MNAIDWINQKYNQQKTLPSFRAGDTVKVSVKIKEGDKERIQLFEGVVIAIHRNGAGSTFTVRKVSYGVGVERIFPLYSPAVSKVEVTSVGKVRRAKLYYLRNLSGKKARIRAGKQFQQLVKDETEPEPLRQEAVPSATPPSSEAEQTQSWTGKKKSVHKKSTQTKA